MRLGDFHVQLSHPSICFHLNSNEQKFSPLTTWEVQSPSGSCCIPHPFEILGNK